MKHQNSVCRNSSYDTADSRNGRSLNWKLIEECRREQPRMPLCTKNRQPWTCHLGLRKPFLRLRIQRNCREVVQQGARCVPSAATAAAALPLCGADCAFVLQPGSSALGYNPRRASAATPAARTVKPADNARQTHTQRWLAAPRKAPQSMRTAEQWGEGGKW